MVKNFIEKNHKIFAALGSLLVMGIIVAGLIFGPFNGILPDSLREKLGYPSANNNQSTEIQLIVNYNGVLPTVNLSLYILTNQTATAYSILLLANLSVQIEEFANGIYVKGINGVLENSTYHWFYYIDGIPGTIASDRYDIKSNEKIEVTWLFRGN